MSIEEAILERVRALPPDKQHEVLDFTEFLRLRISTAGVAAIRPRENLNGLWTDWNVNVSEADIAELRSEMWQNFPREDIG